MRKYELHRIADDMPGKAVLIITCGALAPAHGRGAIRLDLETRVSKPDPPRSSAGGLVEVKKTHRFYCA
jgi:hypothetical protein